MQKITPYKTITFFVMTALVLALDLFSKAYVFSTLGFPNGESAWMRPMLGGWVKFRLHTSLNQGALWGIGQGYTSIFALLSLVAVVGILYWLFIAKAARSWWLTTTLSFVMAGTLGNLYDRLGLPGYELNGQPIYAVRDFLFFTFGTYNYPVFNYADVSLVTGAIMLVIYSLFFDIDAKAKPHSDEEKASQNVKQASPTPSQSASTENLSQQRAAYAS